MNIISKQKLNISLPALGLPSKWCGVVGEFLFWNPVWKEILCLKEKHWWNKQSSLSLSVSLLSSFFFEFERKLHNSKDFTVEMFEAVQHTKKL